MPSQKGSEAWLRRAEKQALRKREKRAADKSARQKELAAQAMAPVDTARWRLDPVGWAEAALGVDRRTLRWSEYGGPYETHTWDGDKDPLALALNDAVWCS